MCSESLRTTFERAPKKKWKGAKPRTSEARKWVAMNDFFWVIDGRRVGTYTYTYPHFEFPKQIFPVLHGVPSNDYASLLVLGALVLAHLIHGRLARVRSLANGFFVQRQARCFQIWNYLSFYTFWRFGPTAHSTLKHTQKYVREIFFFSCFVMSRDLNFSLSLRIFPEASRLRLFAIRR